MRGYSCIDLDDLMCKMGGNAMTSDTANDGEASCVNCGRVYVRDELLGCFMGLPGWDGAKYVPAIECECGYLVLWETADEEGE